MSINKGSQQNRLRLVNSQQTDLDSGVISPDADQLRLLAEHPGLEKFLGLCNHKISITQAQNTALTEKLERLITGISTLIGKCGERIVTNESPDIMVSPYQPGKADILLADSSLPAEATYTYTTGDLASFVGINASRLGTLLSLAKIKGDPRYHYEMRTGSKSKAHMYKLRALNALCQYARNNAVGIKDSELQALERLSQLRNC